MRPSSLVKMTRLRQAKDEAEQEVALYRRHLEEEYQKSISEVHFMTILDGHKVCYTYGKLFVF